MKTVHPVKWILVMCLALGAGMASADIVIDNFNEGGVSISVNNSSVQATDTDTGLSLTNTIGGVRYAELNWQAGTDNTTLQINQPGDNLERCGYGSQPANDGWYQLIYGYSSDLNADLTQTGTNNTIAIQYLFSDIAGTTTVTVTTSGLGSSTLSMNNPMGGEMNTRILFDYGAFSAGADFEDIDQITIRCDGVAGADTIFDFVETTSIPEPSSLALLGLACLGAWRLRRRKS